MVRLFKTPRLCSISKNGLIPIDDSLRLKVTYQSEGLILESTQVIRLDAR